MEKIQDGLLYPEKIDEKDYILGAERSAPFEVINESGNWNSWLVEKERQHGYVDTNGCTNFGSLNMVEILLRYKFYQSENYSERFQAVVAKQNRRGNDPHKVLESIRRFGVIGEALLPYRQDMKFEEYFSPVPMTQQLLDDAAKWLDKYVVKHEYIYNPYGNITLQEKQRLLLQALKRSPVGVSVYAWQLGPTGLYEKPQGARDTHWCVLIGAKEGEYWEVFDSYEPHVKKLAWDFQFDIAKGMWLGIAGDVEPVGFWQAIWSAIKKYFSEVFK